MDAGVRKGTGAGFDGVDLVTVVVGDGERALHLYRDLLGFEVEDDGPVEDAVAWRTCFDLDLDGSGPLRAVVLTKPGARGGALRLVVDPSLAGVDAEPVVFGDLGPMAIDFYVRDLDGLYADLVADGWTFRSPPVRYDLFGTGFAVTEVLMNGPQGLTHSFVEYLEGRHRCVLGDRPEERVSEVIAVVHLVARMDDALAAITGELGASVYLDETFGGPEVELMMALDPGARFRLALARGPGSRNARLEVIAPGGPAAARAGPRVVLGCGVVDLEAVGGGSPPVDLAGPGAPTSSVFVTQAWGARFEFFRRRE